MKSATPRRRVAIALWLLLLAMGLGILARTPFTADLTAFLPKNPTQEQQLLVEQLRDGMVSRMLLLGITGADLPTRAELSRTIAQKMRQDGHFASVSNGESIYQKADQQYLFNNRYLLSPTITEAHFSVTGLHAALSETIDLLASPAGLLVKDILPQDPTGEMATLIALFDSARQPLKQQGVWFSRDGSRALLLAQTHAAGSDTDAQETAIAAIHSHFAVAQKEITGSGQATLILTGPGVFAVKARNTIAQEVTIFSVISASLIMALLFFAYRSGIAVLLGLVPVVSGIVAGVVAVGLGFGMVHAMTLGFGTTMIGEAIDYAIYLLIQSGSAQGSKAWVSQSWPTIRLGVLTSVSGFAALLFSSFPGLAQIGLYTIAGLWAAVFVTRYVLPALLPRSFIVRDVSYLGQAMQRVVVQLQKLRWLLGALLALACSLLWLHKGELWQTQLSALSPVSEADQQSDAKLRKDIGAPDVRYLVVVKENTLENALQAAEKITPQLEQWVENGHLAAYETPTRYLPSQSLQRQRLASLPTAEVLQERVVQALHDLPLRAEKLAPFIAAIEHETRFQKPADMAQRLLTREHLAGTSLSLALDALVIENEHEVTVLLPLTASEVQRLDTALLRTQLAQTGVAQAYFIDLKEESDKLYQGYMQEAIVLALCGMLAMAVMLGFTMRSLMGLARVMLPLVAAVISVAAWFALSGERMGILHLIGLLLIIAVGSNYALFFAQTAEGGAAIAPKTLASLGFANATTVIGFGILGFSSVPTLSAIGTTVGIGVALALLYAAAFSARNNPS